MQSDNETVEAAIATVRKMIHECPAIKGGIALAAIREEGGEK